MIRRRKILLTVAVVGTIVLFVGLRLSLNRIVWSRIASFLQDSYDVDVAVGELSISLLSGKAMARDLRVSDGGTFVMGADELQISASIRDLVDGSYDFKTLVLNRPVVNIVVEKGETTNLARIHARRKHKGGKASDVIFRDARIVDGRCLLVDDQTDDEHPARLSFEHISLTLTELQVAGTPRSRAVGDIRLDAMLAQEEAPARISLVGWAPAINGPLTIALHGAITGLDLAQMPQYVKNSTRRALGGDVIHLGGSMRAWRGTIVDGAIAAEVAETGVEFPMRFGGTTSDVVFDKDSRLASLFRLPFARLGHVGDVALTSTWGAAVDLGKGVYGAGESVVEGVAGTLEGMIRLDPLGALEAAGGGVFGGAKAIGSGLLGSARRIFGGESEEKEAKKAAKQEREFAALHEHCRRSMLNAALESTKNSQGMRSKRIQKEFESAPPESGDGVQSAGI